MSGLGRGYGGGDGLKVSHFTNQDYVRVLTKGGYQGVREGLGIGSDFSLVDNGFIMIVYDLAISVEPQLVGAIFFIWFNTYIIASLLPDSLLVGVS